MASLREQGEGEGERHCGLEGVEEDVEASERGSGEHFWLLQDEMEQQQVCSNGGAHSGAWWSRRYIIEHVACSDVGKVGRRFGLFAG